jgi:D-serine deaminase-like pyridoxal phosphate-dependent protein
VAEVQSSPQKPETTKLHEGLCFAVSFVRLRFLCGSWFYELSHDCLVAARYHRSDMARKFMLDEMPWNEKFRVPDLDNILTPSLVIYPEAVASNIACTLKLLGGDANRWRAHIKTAKLDYTLRMLIDRGVKNFKCATTLELLHACQNGAEDVLLAYPVVGANARRVLEIRQQFPRVRISVLVESSEQIPQWRGSDIGIFLDINPGMNRTGIEMNAPEKLIEVIRAIHDSGLEVRGLHFYDGQYGSVEEPERTRATHAGYDQLLKVVEELRRQKIDVAEVITAGTPTFPCSRSYEKFHNAGFVHRVSPGTVVYNDATSLVQLPAAFGYAPAALVLTRVVSRPHPGIVTCDAGHKAVSADAGVPTCVVVGHPELSPRTPSEEHLPLAVNNGEGAGALSPHIGDALYLLPRHICPTVNNFDAALIVRNGKIEAVERVSARGHEGPQLAS